MVKNPPAMQETDTGSIPGSRRIPWRRRHGNPLQILAWSIPWTEEPGGLQSGASHRVRRD